ncbi:MAG TPA: DUF1553 domain-containing protein, partial [Tepidisphaeraceae bacterium]|nr:DUF1553 domain-containing protein [Tepidisphaeraceae bacterium]
ITLVAWVKIDSLRTGNLVYILGKGRSQKGSHNQNYALRLKGEQDSAHISFLFATAPSNGQAAAWHRWTSDAGFTIDTEWHHVAITYIFGQPDSITGYIDGKQSAGAWDMDGPSKLPPITDDDDLILGTGNGGGKGNSFIGWMDEVAIWRTALPTEILESRYQVAPSAPVVVRHRDLPAGKVLIELCESGLPGRNAWPATALDATETYTEDAFGFFDEPQKYVDTGVRGDRANPHLFRATADVSLPAGKHRLLLRGRGAARLYIDDKLLLSTPFPSEDGSGHGHVSAQSNYLDLGPDFRFRPPGNREAWCEFETSAGMHRVVLETIVGAYAGKGRHRPELGETVAAWSPQGTSSWQLISPAAPEVPYSDAGWRAYRAARQAQLDSINAISRSKLRDEHRTYWDKRHAAAATWLAATKDVAVPPLPYGFPSYNEIDHFIAARIKAVSAQIAQAKPGEVDFYRQVRPILEANCFQCHRGAKPKARLVLDDLAGALKGGKSGSPAIVPGKPEASELIARITNRDDDEVMPPRGDRLKPAEIALIQTWIRQGARWPDMDVEKTTLSPLTDDLTFLRRVTLDTVGVVPTLAEIDEFVADKSPDRRAKVIDRLLADPRWADNWMGYWEDVLAENPNILNPTLNNTGPFRWWIYESLLDNKPMDLFVTELVRQRGSERFGGPAGFGVASQNDVPMAAKGIIVSSAFMGVEMRCARCHDAPFNKSTQDDLFSLGAMLGAKSLQVPKTSIVPLDKLHEGGRKPLIQVTLKPGQRIDPKWPYGEFCDAKAASALAEYPDDPRDQLAAEITAPQNERFAQVMVNRIWKRFMGRGIVEPVDDWERGKPTDAALLGWLARQFVRDGYDVKKLARLILNSHAYQRATDDTLHEPSPLYVAPARRRLAAERIVDSLFAATGKPFRTEEVSLDIDGARDMASSITLGQPRRAWMLTSTSNERDRPSLNLPRIQAVTDVLAAFGWRGARQDPTSNRDDAPNTLQPAILGNGTMGTWLTTLSDDHGITQLALQDQPVGQLVDRLFLKLLTRPPNPTERESVVRYLRNGYDHRITQPAPSAAPSARRKPPPYVSWSNHLDPEATIVRQRQEADARRGDPPTQRLDPAWRSKMEDVLWSMLNAPQWAFEP